MWCVWFLLSLTPCSQITARGLFPLISSSVFTPSSSSPVMLYVNKLHSHADVYKPRLIFFPHKPPSDTHPTCLLLPIVADIILTFNIWKNSNVFFTLSLPGGWIYCSKVALLLLSKYNGVCSCVLTLPLMFHHAEEIIFIMQYQLIRLYSDNKSVNFS